MPNSVDISIFGRHVQPNQKTICFFRIKTQKWNILETSSECHAELTQLSNESPNAENAPPSVDNHDIRFSISIFSHVNLNARRHLQINLFSKYECWFGICD